MKSEFEHIACMEKCVRSLGGETGRKTPLGRPQHVYEDTVKVDLKDR